MPETRFSSTRPTASPALRIALLYVGVGVAWILVSDWMANRMAPAPSAALTLQSAKGVLFVLCSGLFIYLLARRYWKVQMLSFHVAEETRRRMESLVGNLPGMVYRRRGYADAGTEFVSEGCRAVAGYPPEELTAGRVAYVDLIAPEDRPLVENTVAQALERRAPFVATYRIRTAAGAEKWVAEHGTGIFSPTGLEAVEGYVSDVTEYKRYENRLFQAEKMNAVGRMAAGVAHDLNNVLFAILGLSELLSPALPSGSPEAQYVGEIHAAGERAANLVRQLVTIARRQPARTETVDLCRLLKNLESFLERVVGKAVRVGVRVPEASATVMADPSQVEQIVINLAINARDAMPQGGELTVSLEAMEWDEHDAFAQRELKAGRYAVLTVSDTGCGMDKETLSRIFEPFFTTKPPEQGTGLGLATTYSIVRQYGGNIHVYSEPAHGTTFRVYLPTTAAAAAPAVAPARREGTVLVIDDEPGVLRVVSAMLEETGFTVLAAGNAEEALAACEKHAGPLSLIVSDLVLPGVNGRELCIRLRERYPAPPVLYMSGFANDMLFRIEELGPREAYLEKPVTPRALLIKVNELLGRVSP